MHLIIPKHRFGWRPPVPGKAEAYRDGVILHCASLDDPLPDHFDLTDQDVPIYQQGGLGSCTANAIAAAVQFLRQKLGLPNWTPSRLMIYYLERVLEGTVASDAGANLCDGIQSLATTGDCPESLWPYLDDGATFILQPSAAAYAAAVIHKDLQQLQVSQDANSMKKAIVSGYPIPLGFTCFASIESDEVAQSGIVPPPADGEQIVGGHAVEAIGFDDTGTWAPEIGPCFKGRNSWGQGWGQKGYFFIPQNYWTNPNLASDLWQVTLTQ